VKGVQPGTQLEARKLYAESFVMGAKAGQDFVQGRNTTYGEFPLINMMLSEEINQRKSEDPSFKTAYDETEELARALSSEYAHSLPSVARKIHDTDLAKAFFKKVGQVEYPNRVLAPVNKVIDRAAVEIVNFKKGN
jgi:hypothetical protein